ncbi:hypothetical protein FB45DRAFT_824844 [Roridomyces roridus]|uniref:Uncharacterized protein n=1 Tax=Roridomyces roridus TaxID=1738132 RepID=A0AAD7CCP5_9AGAR|nr:hypothetical protein FB45DRAFT_824844 [Roridomyces roridus]
MDASAVNFNVTTDDFDSILSYADQGAWQTPDPSSASYDPKTSQWLLGTFHSTNVTGATVEFNFTGPAIYVFGAAGPAFGSYEVTIDGSSVTKSAYLPSDAASPYMLYGADNLSYADHTLRLRNLGKQGADAGGGEFLFDFLRTTVQLGPAGATVKNQTLEETDSAFKYKGVWGSNKSGNFSGGGSTYTNADNASVSFSFHGSAIYMFGDKKNDHGLYTVVLDGGEPQVFNGISGCGGAFGMTCEQQQPTLAYFASNLDGGLHNLTLTNNAGVNQSYFDLDSVVLSVPSEYAPRTLGDAASSAGGNASSASGSGSAPSASATAGQNGAVSFSGAPLFNPLLCLIGGVLWLLRPSRL